MTRVRAAALALGAAIALLGTAPTDVKTTLRDVAASYYADVAAIARVTGRDTTMDYYNRLVEDLAELDTTPPPNYDATLYYEHDAENWYDSTLVLRRSSCSRPISRCRDSRSRRKRLCARRPTARCSPSPSTFPPHTFPATQRRSSYSCTDSDETRNGTARPGVPAQARRSQRRDRHRALRARRFRLHRFGERRLRRAGCG